MSNKERRFSWVVVSALAICGPCGCRTPAESVKGVVFTKGGVSSSYVISGTHEDPRVKPVQDADISLFFDDSCKDRVEKYSAKSDREGRYSISLKGVPPPKDRAEYYFMSVSKNGYEPLKVRIINGTTHRFITNTIYLRKID